MVAMLGRNCRFETDRLFIILALGHSLSTFMSMLLVRFRVVNDENAGFPFAFGTLKYSSKSTCQSLECCIQTRQAPLFFERPWHGQKRSEEDFSPYLWATCYPSLACMTS